MEVLNTVYNGRNILAIATSIARWVLCVNSGGCMERLMDVSDVVNHKAQGKGLLVIFVGEASSNFLVIVGRFVIAFLSKHLSQSGEGLNGVDIS